jgi:hypothetical protein
MAFKVRGVHGGDYEKCSLLGLRRVALVRADVSEERRVSIIRVRRIGEVGTLDLTRNRHTLT